MSSRRTRRSKSVRRWNVAAGLMLAGIPLVLIVVLAYLVAHAFGGM